MILAKNEIPRVQGFDLVMRLKRLKTAVTPRIIGR